MVSFNVKDPNGIAHLAIWGDGNFVCTDSNNQPLVNNEPASIPKKESSPNTVISFIPTDEFVYFNLSCGRHSFPFREFTVSDGTLHIHGEETSVAGGTVTGLLDLTP